MSLREATIEHVCLLLNNRAKGLIDRNGNIATSSGIRGLVFIILTAGGHNNYTGQEDNVDESLHGAQVYVIFT
jgi:hypothetical protein